ncbi:50S ribosomal protein L3 [Sphaeroforma arctica JP610]|uniref:Large ribosomal subunit protein uL3m n=1 Tax=Sphaeroforma arctica JP610 TaxID=667725 RepID=A0A0L0G5A3_9EUKA|nr:50S ribosomal protein L3 [Sphaeroforma arctica JP610]KNC84210.1 50S ribosomal protein L3 [Sphaeroforma arctica JP610]|eukprot:XP_014158112.1 50S ribosomal protein L3 [Sphaeroforma arctica JP610]
MLTVWSEEGKILPITILQLEDNQVCQTKTIEKEGNAALQIGAREVKKIHKVSMPQIGHYKHAGNGVTLKKKLLDFRITPDATLPVGTPITAAHFVPGQFVDVCATSKGKGFQGGIKRHGMNRQPATHGNSKSHRKMGGTGGCQDPGRVFPGKRMPGHMGNTRVTKLNLRVYRVEPRHNAIYVIGAVPGHKETYVRITDSRRKEFLQPPPFPTHIPSIHGQAAPETTADLNVPIMKQA